MDSDTKAQLIAWNNGVKLHNASTSAAHYTVKSISGALYDLTIKKNEGTYNCCCVHGSVFRFGTEQSCAHYKAVLIAEALHDNDLWI